MIHSNEIVYEATVDSAIWRTFHDMSSFELVIALVKNMDTDSEIWRKWSTLTEEVQKLKDSGKETEAWDLLLETAYQTDPEFVKSVL